MARSRLIFVAGATGKQGGALARLLLWRGHRVRALTRRPDSNVARVLRRLGADVVAGDFGDVGSLERAMLGCDSAFLMTTPMEAGPRAEVGQGLNLIEAARSALVPQVIYSSVADANKNTGVPYFDSKAAIETALQSSVPGWTIIGPTYFMENIFNPLAIEQLRKGHLAVPLSAGRKIQQIALRDIVGFATLVIEKPGDFMGQRIDIAGDELSGAEEAGVLTRETGHHIHYTEVPRSEFALMGEDFVKMFEWMENVGYDIDIPSLKNRYPEVDWRTFETWARSQDWQLLRSQAA